MTQSHSHAKIPSLFPSSDSLWLNECNILLLLFQELNKWVLPQFLLSSQPYLNNSNPNLMMFFPVYPAGLTEVFMHHRVEWFSNEKCKNLDQMLTPPSESHLKKAIQSLSTGKHWSFFTTTDMQKTIIYLQWENTWQKDQKLCTTCVSFYLFTEISFYGLWLMRELYLTGWKIIRSRWISNGKRWWDVAFNQSTHFCKIHRVKFPTLYRWK